MPRMSALARRGSPSMGRPCSAFSVAQDRTLSGRLTESPQQPQQSAAGKEQMTTAEQMRRLRELESLVEDGVRLSEEEYAELDALLVLEDAEFVRSLSAAA